MHLDSVLKHWYNQKSKKEIWEKSPASFDVRKFTSDVIGSPSSDKPDSDESTDSSTNEEC